MSDLTSVERIKLEKLFEMESGYVLNFSNWSFEAFVLENVGIDIYDDKYLRTSTSKANRLREFWRVENNFLVGQLVEELLKYWHAQKTINYEEITPPEQLLFDECSVVVDRLMQGGAAEHLDAIKPFSDESELVLLEKLIRESLLKNEPYAALDRLHTFVMKYIRHICDKYGLEYDRKRSLHGLYGQYAKHLTNEGLIETKITDRILRTFISLLEEFNDVRNNRSFAHDNPILNHRESDLIVSGVLIALKFLRSFEEEPEEEIQEEDDWEIPL